MYHITHMGRYALTETYEDVSYDFIKDILDDMDVKNGSWIQLEVENGGTLRIFAAEQDRLRIYLARFIDGDQKTSALQDASLLDSQEKIWYADEEAGPIPIYRTVTKDYACELMIHFIETGKFARSTSWYGYTDPSMFDE